MSIDRKSFLLHKTKYIIHNIFVTPITDSTDGSTPVNREGAMNKPPSGSDHAMSRNQQDLASRSLGSAMFPDEDSEEGIFHLEVMLAVQRWFSSQGWPSGQFPISIPHSLRRYVRGTTFHRKSQMYLVISFINNFKMFKRENGFFLQTTAVNGT